MEEEGPPQDLLGAEAAMFEKEMVLLAEARRKSGKDAIIAVGDARADKNVATKDAKQGAPTHHTEAGTDKYLACGIPEEDVSLTHLQTRLSRQTGLDASVNSQPGAYSFQPGAEPTRIATPEFSLIGVNSENGASSSSFGPEQPSAELTALTATSTGSDDSGLVVANPVAVPTTTDSGDDCGCPVGSVLNLPWSYQINLCGKDCNVKSTSKWGTHHEEPKQGTKRQKKPILSL